MTTDRTMDTYKRTGLVLERGSGCVLEDRSGKKYLDFASGIGVNSLGHAHPVLVKAIAEQAARIIHSSNYYQTGVAAALSEEVASREDPERLAVEAGRRWAASLDGHDWPSSALVDPSVALDHLVGLLGRLGFAPRTEPLGDRIYLHACPFADLARRHPGVVCGVHLGLLKGLTSRFGSSLSVAAVDPFVRDDLCLVRLES